MSLSAEKKGLVNTASWEKSLSSGQYRTANAFMLKHLFRSKNGVQSLEDPRIYLNTVSVSLSGDMSCRCDPTEYSFFSGGLRSPGLRQIPHSLCRSRNDACASICTHRIIETVSIWSRTCGPNGLPSEAAYIGVVQSKGIEAPKVNVYVPKSSLETRKRVYAPLGANIAVAPLLFDESELDAEAFLTMMAIESLDSAPLYMQIVMVCLFPYIQARTLKPSAVHSSGPR